MLQTQFIDRCSQPDQLNWQGVIDALIAGHQLPRAAITDTVLADGTNRLLNRSARIEGLGYVVKSVTVFPNNPAQEQFFLSLVRSGMGKKTFVLKPFLIHCEDGHILLAFGLVVVHFSRHSK